MLFCVLGSAAEVVGVTVESEGELRAVFAPLVWLNLAEPTWLESASFFPQFASSWIPEAFGGLEVLCFRQFRHLRRQ